MKLPWNREQSSTALDAPDDVDTTTADDADESFNDEPRNAVPTAGKGRPTPSRREAQGRRRGPVAPAPLTRAEARQRKKSTGGPKRTKAERQAASSERRSASAERRQKMLAGDPKYLPAREKGPVKKYVRDLVDSRRHVANLFLPAGGVLLVAIFVLSAVPAVRDLLYPVMFVFLAAMLIEGILIGRSVNARVRERFPDAIEGGFKLGWYAFTRATQLRRMRIPLPQVKPGDAV